MKPNSCTEKAPTDVSPNQEMPVKKHTCTENNRPQGPLKEWRWGQDHAASCEHTPELTHACSTTSAKELARQGLKTLPTARKKQSWKRSSIHFMSMLRSGQIRKTDWILKENPQLIVQVTTVMTSLTEGLNVTWGLNVLVQTEGFRKAQKIVGGSILSPMRSTHHHACQQPANVSRIPSPHTLHMGTWGTRNWGDLPTAT